MEKPKEHRLNKCLKLSSPITGTNRRHTPADSSDALSDTHIADAMFFPQIIYLNLLVEINQTSRIVRHYIAVVRWL